MIEGKPDGSPGAGRSRRVWGDGPRRFPATSAGGRGVGGGSRARRALHIGLAAALLAVRPSPALASVEGWNRWVFEMNRAIEDVVMRPGVERYRQSFPETVQVWIGNAYANLTEPVVATAHAIDANFGAAAESSARFVVNSTLGVLGTIDLADTIGLPKKEKSFSQAVCRSGLPLGAFVVLPVVGPTTAGIALSAVTLMVGSTYVLSFISTELAIASIAVDVIGSAAALEDTVKGAGSKLMTYEALRARFVENLDRICGAA